MESYKILFIDDDEFIRKIYLDRLQSVGFQVELADSATQAKEKLSSQSFDFIFTDYLMADGNGLDLIKWIRQEKKITTPIVVLSASGQDINVMQELKQAGASEYLAKEHALPGDLVEIIKKTLEKKHS